MVVDGSDGSLMVGTVVAVGVVGMSVGLLAGVMVIGCGFVDGDGDEGTWYEFDSTVDNVGDSGLAL